MFYLLVYSAGVFCLLECFVCWCILFTQSCVLFAGVFCSLVYSVQSLVYSICWCILFVGVFCSLRDVEVFADVEVFTCVDVFTVVDVLTGIDVSSDVLSVRCDHEVCDRAVAVCGGVLLVQ